MQNEVFPSVLAISNCCRQPFAFYPKANRHYTKVQGVRWTVRSVLRPMTGRHSVSIRLHAQLTELSQVSTSSVQTGLHLESADSRPIRKQESRTTESRSLTRNSVTKKSTKNSQLLVEPRAHFLWSGNYLLRTSRIIEKINFLNSSHKYFPGG